MKAKKFIKIIGLMFATFLISSCAGGESNGQVSAAFLEEKADELMEEKEYYEAQTLYEVLKSEYEVDVDKKLGECTKFINEEESFIEFDEVIDDFNYEKDHQYILDVNPEYEAEDQYGHAFKFKSDTLNYEELMRAPKEFLNKRVNNYGSVYKIITQEEDYIEVLVNLEGNSTGSYNPNDTSKLVKISCKFTNDSRVVKEADNVMFYGYSMGIDSCELKDGTIKRVPAIRAVNITGLAG